MKRRTGTVSRYDAKNSRPTVLLFEDDVSGIIWLRQATVILKRASCSYAGWLAMEKYRDIAERPICSSESAPRLGPFAVLAVHLCTYLFCASVSGSSTDDSALAPQRETAALKKEGLELAETLMKEFPNSQESIVLMGNVRGRHGNTAEAIEYWNKALQLNPKLANVHNNIGWVAMGKGQYEEAIIHWQRALEVNPSIAGVHKNVALALMALGRHDEVMAELEKEIRISPQSSMSYFLLGQEYLQKKEYDKAKRNYEKAVSLQPNHTNAYYGLFTVCSRLKQPDEAKRHMATFKRLKAEDMKVLKDRNSAFDDLVSVRKSLAETYVEAHRLYRKRGDTQKAEELLERANALDPENTEALIELASLCAASNRMSEALELNKRVIEIEPNNTICRLNIGLCSARLRQFADAEQAFLKVIELAPNSSSGYRELALLYLRAGMRLPEAKQLAEKALMLEPIAANYFALSFARDRNGDTAGAISALKRAVELEPDNRLYRRTYELILKRK